MFSYVFGEGGHEPEECTKGELVRREQAGLRVVDIDRKLEN